MVYLYPTASTSAVFINGYHLEQAYQIQYKDSAPKIPIYGYNDYTFSRVIRGKGLVQGIVIVNFIFAGYLTSVLEYQKEGYSAKLYNYGFTIPGTSQKEQFQSDLKTKLRNELPPNNTVDERRARAEYIASLISNNRSEAVVRQTKEALETMFYNPEDSPTSEGIVTNPLSIGSKRTMGNQLDIYYQDPSYVNWFVRFNDVHFSDVSQQISQAGAEGSSEPLYEVYSFIARDKEIRTKSNG